MWTKCSTLKVSVRCFIMSKFEMDFLSNSKANGSEWVCLKHEIAKFNDEMALLLA